MNLVWAFLITVAYQTGVGGLRPVAMERTIETIDEAFAALGTDVRLPCDPEGNPS